MVRRRIRAGDCANPLTFSACQHLLPSGTSYVNNQKLLHWQAQQQQQLLQQQQHQQQQQQRFRVPQQSLVSSMQKLTGRMPRIPTFAQREVSQRMQQQPMSWPQQFINIPNPAMPLYVQDTSLNPLSLPMWCHSSEDIFNNSSHSLDQQNRQQASDISLELKQQMEQLRTHHQLLLLREQKQQQQQQKQQRQQLRQTNFFVPFNFGKCANEMINFYDKKNIDSESVLYSATHPLMMLSARGARTARKPPPVPAKPAQMPKQPNLPPAQPQKMQVNRKQPQMVKRTPLNLRVNCDSGPLPKKDVPSTESSTTTLINKPEPQTKQKLDNCTNQCQPSLATLLATQQELEDLALNIDKNLSAVRQLLIAEPAQELPKMTQPARKPGLLAKSNAKPTPKEVLLTPEELDLLEKILEEEEVHRVAIESAMKTCSTTAPIKTNDGAERAAIGSHKRQLNLNKLFEQNKLQNAETSPLWNSLMQLVTRMCDNPEESTEPGEVGRMKAGSGNGCTQKQYSIYLIVSSDDEAEQEATKSMTPPKNEEVPDMKQQIPPYLPMNMENICVENYQQEQLKPVRKKKRISFKPRNEEIIIYPMLPPRPPLHWPKPDLSKPPTQKKRKKFLRHTASKTSNRVYNSRFAMQDAIECSKWGLNGQRKSPLYMPHLPDQIYPNLPLPNCLSKFGF